MKQLVIRIFRHKRYKLLLIQNLGLNQPKKDRQVSKNSREAHIMSIYKMLITENYIILAKASMFIDCRLGLEQVPVTMISYQFLFQQQGNKDQLTQYFRSLASVKAKIEMDSISKGKKHLHRFSLKFLLHSNMKSLSLAINLLINHLI